MNEHQLNAWLAEIPGDVDAWLTRGLELGCKFFNLHTGIVSTTINSRYVIKASYSELGDVFKPGDDFDLENTYCDALVKQKKTITYESVGDMPNMRLHPVYTAFQLESYIGTPVYGVDQKIIGTISFSSHDVRNALFDESEHTMIERMSKKITSIL
jgi:hypothetical protein